MHKKTINQISILFVTLVLFIVLNLGCYFTIAKSGSYNTYNSQELGTNDLFIQVDQIIEPPLGNDTRLESITALFSQMVLVLPIEITIIFTAEIILGSALKLNPKKFNLTRLGIMLGSSFALSILVGLVNYLIVFPALHDIPIHRKTFILPGTGTGNITENPPVYIPQYGSAPTFFSFGVDILMLIIAAILLVGLHFAAFKFIQGFNFLNAGVSSALPILFYPIIWNSLLQEVTKKAFDEKTGSIWTILLIIAGGYILIMILVLIWKLTLLGTSSTTEVEISEQNQ